MNPLLGYLFNILGFVVGATLYWFEARRRGCNVQQVMEVAMFGIVAGMICASLSQWIYNEATQTAHSMSAFGGRTIIGGIIGAWAAVEIYKKRVGIMVSTGPMWAVALPAGEVFGRVGCWFHGCCSGVEALLPWSMYQHGAWRHPTQIYLAVAAAVSFAVVWRLRDSKDIFPISLMLWASGRLIIEPFRESSQPTPWLVPTVCIVVIVGSGYRVVSQWKKSARVQTQ